MSPYNSARRTGLLLYEYLSLLGGTISAGYDRNHRVFNALLG
jgi:hypothetical protein